MLNPSTSINKKQLVGLYQRKNMSMTEISKQLGCSVHKVAYWMESYDIKRRSISSAVYLKHNPKGDPFETRRPKTTDEKILYGVGIGLYWAEGTKSNRHAVRLGNSDPKLIRIFILFLTTLCGVDTKKLRFFLQVFSDIEPHVAIDYWVNELEVSPSQFYKPIITRSGAIGNYRVKNKYGVVTIYFGNTKLRNKLIEQIADIAQG